MYNIIADIGTDFVGGNTNLTNPSGIGVFVSNAVSGAISAAGVILLFLLIGGGIAMIAGAGNSDPKTVETGKKAATSALIGFIVVFSAFWIVRLIETVTGLVLISP